MTEPLEGEEKECKGCGYALAGIGMLIGIAFLYISFDVLTHGGLTSSLGLGTNRKATVDADS